MCTPCLCDAHVELRMPCLQYRVATDGSKICWTLESDTQHPYAKPKLLSVCLSPLVFYIAHMAEMLDGAPAALIICPMVPCLKMDQFGSHIGT